MTGTARSVALAVALLVLAGALGAATLRERTGLGPLHNPTDLVAFYCGGRVARAGHDPYRAEPLRACERAAFAESGVPMFAGLVVPAPLPGYALALFAPLAALSFRVAALIWAALLVGCTIASAALVARSTKLRPDLVFACFFSADLGASIVVGQLVPVVVLALCCAGAALDAGRVRTAAIAAAAMAVEPHLALPACLALVVWRPATRVPLVAIGVACALLNVLVVGPAASLEYLTTVLPAQARGEGLEFNGQYGLSAALHAVGVGANVALAYGALSYALMVALGVAIARRASERFAEPALLVYVPVAFALLGGAYVHIYQMAAALPLALVAFAHARERRALAAVALAALAIPWQTLVTQPALVALFPAPPHVDPAPLLARVAGASRLAEDVWSQWMLTASNRDHRTRIELFATKLPTWLALAAFATSVVRASLADGRQPGRKRLAPR